MKINIRGPEDIDTRRIKQTLMFYLSRVELSVTSLDFDLKQLQSVGGQPRYSILLTSRLINGQTIRFEETQSDARLAMQRLMDRLERQLHRRQVAQDLGYVSQGSG